MERTAYWTAADDQPVSREDAEKAWTVEAHTVLSRVAGTYPGGRPGHSGVPSAAYIGAP